MSLKTKIYVGPYLDLTTFLPDGTACSLWDELSDWADNKEIDFLTIESHNDLFVLVDSSSNNDGQNCLLYTNSDEVVDLDNVLSEINTERITQMKTAFLDKVKTHDLQALVDTDFQKYLRFGVLLSTTH